MSTIAVRTGPRKTMQCVVSGPGTCRYCYGLVVWATTPNGKFIPLQLWSGDVRETEAHFAHCKRRTTRESSRNMPSRQPAAQGVPMTIREWKQLMRLVHPDLHRDRGNEELATEMTRWLLEQRERLTNQQSR